MKIAGWRVHPSCFTIIHFSLALGSEKYVSDIYFAAKIKKSQSAESANTSQKFNIAPEKWWLEDYCPIEKGNFSGAMLNFGKVSTFTGCYHYLNKNGTRGLSDLPLI